MDRQQLKFNARQQLGGGIFRENWLLGLVAVLIFTTIISMASGIISLCTSLVSVFNTLLPSIYEMAEQGANNGEINPLDFLQPYFSASFTMGIGTMLLITVLLSSPLTYGVQKTFLDLVMGGEKIELGTVFSGFRKYGETVLLGFMRYLFTSLWSLLFIIPGIVKNYAYSLSYFIKIENPAYTWRQCMAESERLTKGYKLELFILDLSFLGWYILGTFAFGIGILWVYPYHYCTVANFYAWRIAQEKPAADAAFASPDAFFPPEAFASQDASAPQDTSAPQNAYDAPEAPAPQEEPPCNGTTGG